MSYTSAQLEAQVGVARAAIGKPTSQGGITPTQYSQWYAKQQILIREAKAREAAQTQKQEPLPVTTWSNPPARPEPAQQPSNVSPVPSNPANPYMVDSSGKVWVKQGYDVKTETVTVPAKITAEEKQTILTEAYRVAAMPESNAEAIAAGKDSYIPKEQKEAYYQQVRDYFNQTQTQTVYKITPKPQPQQQGEQATKSITERMLDVQVTPLFGANTVNQLLNVNIDGRAPKSEPNRPLAPFAGLIAPVEAIVYSVGSFVGVKNLPVPPPTVSSGLIGKGVQGAASLVGVNAQSNELETVMTNPRYAGAYAVGTVFGDVLTGFGVGAVAKKGIQAGGKAVSVVAPKIDLAAESVLARSTRLAEASINKVKPGYGRVVNTTVHRDWAKAGVVLDATEAKLNQAVVKPVLNLKYGQAANKAVDATVTFKDKAVTVGQRAADAAMPSGSSEPDLFMRAVVRPNLKNYSRITDTTFKLYGERISTSETLGDLKLATSTPLKEASKNIVDTAKLAATYQKVVVAPKMGVRVAAKETKNIVSPLVGEGKQGLSSKAFKQFWGNIEGNLREVPSRVKVSKDPYGTKALLSKLSKSNLDESQVTAIRRNILGNEVTRAIQNSNTKTANTIASQLAKEQAKLESSMAKKTVLGKRSFGAFWETVEGKPQVPKVRLLKSNVNNTVVKAENKIKPKRISNAIIGKNLLKENIDPTKLTGMSRASKQAVVAKIRVKNLGNALKGKKGIAATENIASMDANKYELMMSKRITRSAKARTLKQLEGPKVKDLTVAAEDKIIKAIKNDAPAKKSRGANPIAVQLDRTTNEATKNMSGGMTKPLNVPYPKTRIVSNREEEETSYLTFPKQPLSINKPSVSSINIINDGVTITPDISSPNMKRIFREGNKATTKAKQNTNLTPAIAPTFDQGLTPIQNPAITEIMKPATTPKPAYKVTDIQIAKDLTDVKLKPLIPTLNLGGGFGGASGGSVFRGKWFKKKHQIKTYQQMLKTFGLDGTAKDLGNVDKAMSKIERQVKHFEKGFKPKHVKKSKRRRKR